jgi:hypothetical protein
MDLILTKLGRAQGYKSQNDYGNDGKKALAAELSK